MEIFSEVKLPLPRGMISVVAEGPTHGRREVKTTNAPTKRLLERMYSSNIHDNGYHNLESFVTKLVLGDGTTPIDFNSTALGNQTHEETSVNRSRNTFDVEGVTWTGITHSKTLNPGVFVGTIREVGVADADSLLAGKVLDTEIEVFSDDQVSIQYTLAVDTNNHPQTLATGTIDVNGSSYNYTVTHSKLFSVSGTSEVAVLTPAVTAGVGESFQINNTTVNNDANGESTITETYDGANRYCEWLLDALVYASWSGTEITSLRPFQANGNGWERPISLTFSPAIPKPGSHKIIFKFRLRFTW